MLVSFIDHGFPHNMCTESRVTHVTICGPFWTYQVYVLSKFFFHLKRMVSQRNAVTFLKYVTFFTCS